MDAAQEKVAVTVRTASTQEVLPFIERAGHFNTGGWKFDAASLAEKNLRFVVEQDGQIIGGYLLEVRDGEICIVAAAGNAKLDLTRVGFDIVEKQAAGFESVGFTTKRRSLVKKALRHGYRIDGFVMRKKL